MSNLIQTYSKYPIKIVKGKGSYVWDDKGKKYLDFYGGHAVCIIGHCPKMVIKAINEQSEKLLFYSNIVETGPQEDLAKLLCPKDYQVFLTNSGSEANEAALKIARRFTGKKEIISFKGSFHGRSISNISITGIDKYHKFLPDLTEFTKFATLGDMQSVAKCYNQNTAAVILEPIQSIAGIKMANMKFYKELAKFCGKKKILLIFDEIQTGLGRTGTFWFSEKLKIKPDIFTCAKGLASGLPIGGTIVKKSIAQTIKPDEHGTTFGGGPVQCAAGVATIKEIKKILPKTSKKAKYLKSQLKKHPKIKKIHGEGLLIGIELNKPDDQLIKKCLKNGLIVGSSFDPKIFRLMPPININKKEIDEFIEKFPNE